MILSFQLPSRPLSDLSHLPSLTIEEWLSIYLLLNLPNLLRELIRRIQLSVLPPFHQQMPALMLKKIGKKGLLPSNNNNNPISKITCLSLPPPTAVDILTTLSFLQLPIPKSFISSLFHLFFYHYSYTRLVDWDQWWTKPPLSNLAPNQDSSLPHMVSYSSFVVYLCCGGG